MVKYLVMNQEQILDKLFYVMLILTIVSFFLFLIKKSNILIPILLSMVSIFILLYQAILKDMYISIKSVIIFALLFLLQVVTLVIQNKVEKQRVNPECVYYKDLIKDYKSILSKMIVNGEYECPICHKYGKISPVEDSLEPLYHCEYCREFFNIRNFKNK